MIYNFRNIFIASVEIIIMRDTPISVKCRCGGRAVIYRRFDGQALCKEHFLRGVERRVKQLIRKEKLLEDGDKIAVGLSGGKDSTLTLYMLNEIVKKSRKYSLSAIAVDEGIKGYRKGTIKHARKLCRELNVDLHVATFKDEFGKTMDQIVKSKDARACTYCGVLRRYLMNKTARKLGATKVAIGHNMDDEVQSIMANYIRGDMLRAVRLGAKAYVVKDAKFIPRIKPLREIPEKETALYCMLKGFDTSFGECPYAHESFRWSVRDIVNGLEDKYPGTKYSILRTFDRLLPKIRKEFLNKKIRKCESCGEPTSKEVCKVCLLRRSL